MRIPRQPHYRVQRGDTLSKIALNSYGDADVWPELAKANGLPNGNVILVGMTLKLPHLPAKASSPAVHHVARAVVPPVSSRPAPGFVGPVRPGAAAPAAGSPLAGLTQFPVARAVTFPPLKYKLDTLPAVVITTANAVIKVKLSGDIAIQQQGVMAEIEWAQSGAVSQKLKAEYDSKFVKLADQVKVRWDPVSREAEVSCGFTIATKVNGKEFVSHTYEYTPPNRFRYTLKPKEVSGERDGVIFKGTLGYEVEITIRSDESSSKASLPVPSSNRQVMWVVVGALIVGGAVIIVADLAKDVATLGVGAVESPLSFAAAAALFGRAAQLAH